MVLHFESVKETHRPTHHEVPHDMNKIFLRWGLTLQQTPFRRELVIVREDLGIHSFVFPCVFLTGGFFGEHDGVGDGVFANVISDAVNRVQNNRTLLPEPHKMSFVSGDQKPVNAVYTAIEDSKSTA